MFASTILTTLALLIVATQTANPDLTIQPHDSRPPQEISLYFSDKVFDIDKLQQDLLKHGENFAQDLYGSLSNLETDEKILQELKFSKKQVEKLESVENKKNKLFIKKILIELLDIKLEGVKEGLVAYKQTVGSLITSGFKIDEYVFHYDSNEEEISMYEISFVKILRVFLLDVNMLKSVIGTQFSQMYEFNLYLAGNVMLLKQEIRNDKEIRKFYCKVFSEIISCSLDKTFSLKKEVFLNQYSWFISECFASKDGETLRGFNLGFTIWALLQGYPERIWHNEKMYLGFVEMFLRLQISKNNLENSENLKRLYLLFFCVNRIFEIKDGVIRRLEKVFRVFEDYPRSKINHLNFDDAYNYETFETGETPTDEFKCAYKLVLFVLNINKDKPILAEKNIDVVKLLNILRKVDYFDVIYEKNSFIGLKCINSLRDFKLFTTEENIEKIIDHCDDEIFLRSRLAKDIFSTKEFSDHYAKKVSDNHTELKGFLYRYVYYQGTSSECLKTKPEKEIWKITSIFYWLYNYFFPNTHDEERIMSNELSEIFMDETEKIAFDIESLSGCSETEKIVYVVGFIEALAKVEKETQELGFINTSSNSYVLLKKFLIDELFTDKRFGELISESKKGMILVKKISEAISVFEEKCGNNNPLREGEKTALAEIQELNKAVKYIFCLQQKKAKEKNLTQKETTERVFRNWFD